MKNVILISTVTVEERTKDGKKLVYYVAELQNVNQRKNVEKNIVDFNYVVKTVEKKEDGTIPIDPDGSVIGTFKQSEVGGIDLADVDFDVANLPVAADIEELQHNINIVTFNDYCNTNGIYDLSWELLE